MQRKTERCLEANMRGKEGKTEQKVSLKYCSCVSKNIFENPVIAAQSLMQMRPLLLFLGGKKC